MPSSSRPKPKTSKNTIQPVVIELGETIERVIFTGSRKGLERRGLHVAVEPIVRAWLRAACKWDAVAIGQHRYVIFFLDVAPATQVYVQFWSESMEPVVCEVCSGRSDPPADEWLAGERAQRIEALGFAIGGKADNYQRGVRIESAADIATVAKDVVRILYDGFDYRGTAPIRARLVYESRSETRATYDSFMPEDLSKLFFCLGFRVERAILRDDADAPPMIRCRKRGINTVLEFEDRVADENLYQRVSFAADIEIPEEERRRLKRTPEAPKGREPILNVSVVHRFGGGVTLPWLVERITEWDIMLEEQRRAMRRANKAAVAARLTGSVH